MAERVHMMDCGDGIRRADIGSAGKGPVNTATNYTVKEGQTGTIFTNATSTGPVTFTLPPPKPGIWFTFVKAVPNQNVVLQMPAGVVINAGTAGKAYQNLGNEAGVCQIMGLGTAAGVGYYVILAEKGSWSNNNT